MCRASVDDDDNANEPRPSVSGSNRGLPPRGRRRTTSQSMPVGLPPSRHRSGEVGAPSRTHSPSPLEIDASPSPFLDSSSVDDEDDLPDQHVNPATGLVGSDRGHARTMPTRSPTDDLEFAGGRSYSRYTDFVNLDTSDDDDEDDDASECSGQVCRQACHPCLKNCTQLAAAGALPQHDVWVVHMQVGILLPCSLHALQMQAHHDMHNVLAAVL